MISSARLIAIGRYTEGVNVLGYIIKDLSTGESKLLPRADVEKLALDKKICNITAQVYCGKILIKGIDCKLSSLPNYDSKGRLIDKTENVNRKQEGLMVTARIMNGKSTTGYVLALLTNGAKCGEKRLSKDKVIQLAEDGHIMNLRVQKSNGKYVLRGVNCELAKLPSIKQNVSVY